MGVEGVVTTEGVKQTGPYVLPQVAASVAVARLEGSARLTEVKHPQESVVALEMLAMGASYKEIKEKTGLSVNAVMALKARHPMALDVRRKQLAADALEIAEGIRLLQKEKIAQLANDPEALAKTNLRDLTLPWGISMDKFFGALGEAQTVVEHRTNGMSIEDAQKMIEAARARVKAASVEVDVTPVDNSKT